MGDVIEFPKRYVDLECWVCGCGGYHWVLLLGGRCMCTKCESVSGIIKVVEGDPDVSEP